MLAFLIGCMCMGMRPIRVFAASAGPTLVYVPLDTRPVSLGLPQMLAAAAGVDLRTPPRDLLGEYLVPGDPERIAAWLQHTAPLGDGIVVSTDMLGYGGLVASRLPDASQRLVARRLTLLRRLRRLAPRAEIDGFGTIMRLAPTGVPQLGAARSFFAAGPDSLAITAYANLPRPLVSTADREVASALRKQLGPTLDRYLAARRRNLAIDRSLLDATARRRLDFLVLGQDDAGPVGLHLADIADLRAHARSLGLAADRASIESGTDELGMVLLARNLVRRTREIPQIAVAYSRPGAEAVHDQIEFEPIDPTIEKLIALVGARRVAQSPAADLTLFVYVAGTDAAGRAQFIDAIAARLAAGGRVALADLSFIGGSLDDQRELLPALIARKIAARLDGYGSWNTDANSVGTALAAAMFVRVGRMYGSYNAAAHATYLLDRYADDYAYRLLVRQRLTDALHQESLEQAYLLPGSAERMEGDARALLWEQVLTLQHDVFPEYALCRATIILPWRRTFETELRLKLQSLLCTVETTAR